MPFITNRGVKIHYELEGEGPPLILQHGLAGSGDTWRSFGYARGLSRDYTLILVDARGHGLSDKPHSEKDYRLDTVAADYTAILDALQITRAAYFGYSLGARIGYACIVRFCPMRFNAIILGGASPYAMSEMEKQSSLLLQAAIRTSGLQSLVDYFEKREGPLPPIAKARILDNDPEALVTLMQVFQLEWSAPDAVLPDFKVPVLLFAGNLDPLYSRIQKAALEIPGARLASIPDCGHYRCWANSRMVIPTVKDFLAETIKPEYN